MEMLEKKIIAEQDKQQVRQQLERQIDTLQISLVQTIENTLNGNIKILPNPKKENESDSAWLERNTDYNAIVAKLDAAFFGATGGINSGTEIGRLLDSVVRQRVSPEFQKAVDNIRNILDGIPWPKMYVYDLALATMREDLIGRPKKLEDIVDLETNKYRLLTLLKSQGFKYEVASQAEAERVFKERIISINDAFRQYPVDEENILPLNEAILAGGDATRFLKMINIFDKYLRATAIEYVKANHAQKIKDLDINKIQDNEFWERIVPIIGEDAVTFDKKDLLEIFKKEIKGNKDLEEIMPKDMHGLKQMMDIPMFHFMRGLGKINSPHVEYDATTKTVNMNLRDLMNVVKITLGECVNLPKAMIYAVRLTDESNGIKDPLYINYAWIKIIRMLVEARRSGVESGHKIYLMLKDGAMAEAFKQSEYELRLKGLLGAEDFFKIYYLERPSDSIVLSDNGFLQHDSFYRVRTASAGHGPAFIKAAQQEDLSYAERAMTFQTIDNMGSEIPNYTALIRRALLAENKLIAELDNILQSNKEDGARLAKIQELLKKSYGYDDTALRAYTSAAELLKTLLSGRWSYNYAEEMDAEKILETVKKMPITIAVVVPPEPTGQAGGGLHVKNGTDEMAIVDKITWQSRPERDEIKDGKVARYAQEKERDYKTFFNPMLFATYTPAPDTLGMKFENNALFLSVGKPEKGLRSVESASTHLATSDRVLKRMIEVPLEDSKRVFQQNKFMEETNAAKLREISEQLIEDLHYLADETNIPLNELYPLIFNAQEKARTSYLRSIYHEAEKTIERKKELEKRVEELRAKNISAEA